MEGQQKMTDLQSRVKATQENKSRAYRQIVGELRVQAPSLEPISQSYIHIGGLSTENWSTAERNCQEMGGHLASFDTKGELEALSPELKNSTRYWIGIRNVHRGEFKVWATGMPARYLKWGDGYPCNGNMYNCVFLYNGFMYNFLCGYYNHYICNVDKDN
ncbi:C-type lectin 37Db-like [Drosophila rhopaloa]|uniref:Low affinity immunoglobulin epsilon Fc receptor-like n=1 Tax=Drosophila rhopaloa TaxID=1041015 RepID=A0A6P4EDT2_DRORH|nr:C-type lectin 37Db-like [Drosophila rhopaloa]